jgi:hypothetical protein
LQNFQDFRGFQLLDSKQGPARDLVHPKPAPNRASYAPARAGRKKREE